MKQLSQIVLDIDESLEAIDLQPIITKCGLRDESAHWLKASRGSGSEYYRALAAAAKSLQSKQTIELGTYRGLSAMALSMGADRVATYDLDLGAVEPCCASWPGLQVHRTQDPNDVLDLDFSAADLVFVDISHEGDIESRIHERLCTQFRGIAFYDDIFLNRRMLEFWLSIRNPREATNWHFSGFGVVDYRSQSVTA